MSEPVINDVVLISGTLRPCATAHADVDEILVRPMPPTTGVAPGGGGSGE